MESAHRGGEGNPVLGNAKTGRCGSGLEVRWVATALARFAMTNRVLRRRGIWQRDASEPAGRRRYLGRQDCASDDRSARSPKTGKPCDDSIRVGAPGHNSGRWDVSAEPGQQAWARAASGAGRWRRSSRWSSSKEKGFSMQGRPVVARWAFTSARKRKPLMNMKRRS